MINAHYHLSIRFQDLKRPGCKLHATSFGSTQLEDPRDSLEEAISLRWQKRQAALMGCSGCYSVVTLRGSHVLKRFIRLPVLT